MHDMDVFCEFNINLCSASIIAVLCPRCYYRLCLKKILSAYSVQYQGQKIPKVLMWLWWRHQCMSVVSAMLHPCNVCNLNFCINSPIERSSYWWLSTKLQVLKCSSNLAPKLPQKGMQRYFVFLKNTFLIHFIFGQKVHWAISADDFENQHHS